MANILQTLEANAKGNVAVLFGIAALPLMGVVGGAVDYSRATALKTEMHNMADGAALAIVMQTSNLGEQQIRQQTKEELLRRHGGSINDISVDGEWVDADHYRVVVRADIRSSLLRAIPVHTGVITTEVETVARRPAMAWIHENPETFPLNAEANDYNRVYSYCFDPARSDEEDKGRRDFRVLFDNGVPENEYDEDMSECNANETLSLKLRNVRGARRNPEEWDDPNEKVYEYFSDSVLDPITRTYTHNHKGYRVRNGWKYKEITLEPDTFETVLCPTRADCVTISEGGVLPDYEDNRNANVATEPCEPGSYMYFAWEDRPKGHGWTDMDFNDIRFVISCPDFGVADSSTARIVR